MGKKQTTGSDPFAEFGGTAIEQQPPFPQAPTQQAPAPAGSAGAPVGASPSILAPGTGAATAAPPVPATPPTVYELPTPQEEAEIQRGYDAGLVNPEELRAQGFEARARGIEAQQGAQERTRAADIFSSLDESGLAEYKKQMDERQAALKQESVKLQAQAASLQKAATQQLSKEEADFMRAEQKTLHERAYALAAEARNLNIDKRLAAKRDYEIKSGQGSAWGATWNNLLGSVGGAVSGLNAPIASAMAEAMPATPKEGETQDQANRRMINSLRQAMRGAPKEMIGDDETTDEYIAEMQKGFLSGPWLAVTSTVPLAALGPAGTGMMLSAADNVMREVEDDPSFENIPEWKKYTVAYTIGAITGQLEKAGFRGAVTGSGVVKRILNRAIDRMPAGSTEAQVRAILNQETKSAIANMSGRLASSMAEESFTEGVQAGVEPAMKDIFNAIEEKNLIPRADGSKGFETPNGFSGYVTDMFENTKVGALGGAIMGTPVAVWKMTKEASLGKNTNDAQFQAISDMLNDPDMQDVLMNDIRDQVASGTMSAAKAREIEASWKQAKSILYRIPKGLSPEARREAYDLLAKKDELSLVDKSMASGEVEAIDQQLAELVKKDAIARAEADKIATTLPPNLENVSLSQEENDRIAAARAELGIEFDALEGLTDGMVMTFNRVENELPTSPSAIEEVSAFLYTKYKDLQAMKLAPRGILTIDQIDGLMEQLGSDIELLETYKQKQREQAEGVTGAQTQPEIQADAGADTQAAQEGGQGQQRQVIAQAEEVVTPTPQENGTVPVGQAEEVPVQPEAGSGQEVPGAQQEVEPAAAQERPQDPIGGLAPEVITELDDVLRVAETPPAVSPEGPVRPEGPTPQAMRVKGPAAPRKMIYVKNVQKALAQEVPGLKVTVHQDPQQYRAAIEAYNKANNTTADPSASVAIYLPGTNEIHLSPGADGQSLAHEAAHPIVSALIANKPELFNRLYDEIAADPALKNIMDFGKLYADTNETVIKAETIVRFMDAVASGEIKVSTDPKSAWQRFKAWLSEILAKMGLGPKDIDLSNPANVREFASMFSRAISEGIEIRKIRGDKGTADAGPMMQRRSPSEVAATFSKHGLSPDQAMEYMKQRGVSDDFAQQVVAEMQPKEEAETTAAPAEEERVKKTLVTKRAYEGDFRSEVKAEIEKVGLYRDTETHEQAKAKANELIQRIGLDAALDAVRAGDIRGGAAAYVWNAAMENTDEQIMKADSQEELARLYSEQAQLLEEAGIQQLESGRFGSAWASIYDGSGLGYNAAAQSKKWKDSFGKEPSDEMKEEWRKRDEEIAELKKKILEAEKRAEEAEANAAVNAIKQSINRKGGVRKTHTQRAKEVADQFRKLKTKPIQFKDADGNPIDVTRMGFDWNELVEVGARAIEKAGQGADMVAAAMKAISEKLNEYEWYRNLSQRDRDAVDEQIREQYMAQSDDGMETGSMTIPKSLVRDIVASGVSDIDTLVAKVKEAVADTYPNATDREIRDAITDYGRVLNMSKDEISAEVRRLRALGRMISAIEDVSAGKRPLRSGLQRDRMDAELRAKSKELRQLMKNLPVDQETMDRELKTALDAAKTRVRNRIEDLQREIDTRQRTPRNTKAVEPDQELTDLIAERDALQERHDQVFGSSSMTAEERLSAAINSAKRSADEIERRIANMELEPKKREPVKETPELARERARLAAARAELNSLREQAGIIEAKRLDAAKKAARKRIDDLQRRLRDGDFSKKQIKRVDEDAELTKLRGERLRLQDQYDKEFEKERIRQRSTREKAMDAAWELYGLTRALQATAEFSFVLIQGGKLTISNLWHKPSAVAYAFKNALSGAARESRTEEWISNIRAQEWYPLAKKSGLAITEPSAKLTAREEVFFSGWSEFIWSAIGSPLRLVSKKLFDKWNQYNVFRIIERAAVMYLDTLRVERWLDAMEALDMRKAEGKEVSEKDYKDAANMINTLTGRASLGPAERMAPVLSKVFFSPRLWASSVKTATPYALYHFGKMSPTARNMALADMGRYIGTTMAFVALAGINLDDDDDEKTYVETDPRSADFGKIRMGNRRIDPWGGMAQQVVWTSRIVADILGMQSYKRTSGEIMRLGEKNAPTGLDITVQMATNKLAPSASLIAERMTTKLNRRGDRVTKYGEEYDPVSSIAERLYPIYAGTVIDLMKNDPGALEGFLVAYAFFGGGVQEYEDKKKKKSKND